MKIPNWLILIIFSLVVFDAVVWREIVFSSPAENPEIYFLNVGQGDSELIVLPNNTKILIDAGPNDKIVGELSRVLSPFDRYVDLVVLSHPELDHFGGMFEVFKRYQIGAFISTGVKKDTKSFAELEKLIERNKIPEIVLAEGDKIRYRSEKLEILSPSKELLGKSANDAAFVIKLVGSKTALFTADIGEKVEKSLVGKYDLKSDILKVAHHGSKYSSSKEFLQAVLPKISVIEVGKNSYGHPTDRVLADLASVGSKIFRTDQNGTLKLTFDIPRINIFSLR